MSRVALEMTMEKMTRIMNRLAIEAITVALCVLLLLIGMIAKTAGAAEPKPAVPPAAQAQAAPADNDHTLAAMQDELNRARERLTLTIPGQTDSARPYFIQYRILDLDVHTIVAQFGALISFTTGRNRVMTVDVRVGDYNLDSSNFIAEEGFSGFLGANGTVGIDRDYDSLRQDLWLATDQAFKAAVENLSKKKAFLTRLANAPTIPDFSTATPTVQVDPLQQPDWTTRNWEQEARTVSAALRVFPQLQNSRVTYHLIYTTAYTLNTEGTKIRVNHSLAAIEASIETESDDGMPLHNFLAVYRARPGQLPAADDVRNDLQKAGQQLIALRQAPVATDYDGPVLFEAPAASSLLAQVLTPSISGARGPLAMQSAFDQLMDRLGGHSEWTGKLGMRVLPGTVTLLDDPLAKQFAGQDLLGSYDVDEEGVKSEQVQIAKNGLLLDFLMSRRPGPDLVHSNGHGRTAFLGDTHPMVSNLFFTSTTAESPADLKKKFMDDCKQNGNRWCLVVRSMDNPALGAVDQDEVSGIMMNAASGAGTGDRLPLMVYRVNVDDGVETLVRGARLSGLTVRAMRNIAGIGNDSTVFPYIQSQQVGLAGTALSAFGTAESGVPADVIAPSLLFDDVEVHGARGEPERSPLVPAPPLN